MARQTWNVKIKVYMTADISPAGLRTVYVRHWGEKPREVAVKIPAGEPANPNHLAPDLIKGLARPVNGTFVECDVACGGPWASSAMYRRAAKDNWAVYETEGNNEI